MCMTTLSCVSTEFGGFLKDSPVTFQLAPEHSTEFSGLFRTGVPNDAPAVENGILVNFIRRLRVSAVTKLAQKIGGLVKTGTFCMYHCDDCGCGGCCLT